MQIKITVRYHLRPPYTLRMTHITRPAGREGQKNKPFTHLVVKLGCLAFMEKRKDTSPITCMTIIFQIYLDHYGLVIELIFNHPIILPKYMFRYNKHEKLKQSIYM